MRGINIRQSKNACFAASEPNNILMLKLTIFLLSLIYIRAFTPKLQYKNYLDNCKLLPINKA